MFYTSRCAQWQTLIWRSYVDTSSRHPQEVHHPRKVRLYKVVKQRDETAAAEMAEAAQEIGLNVLSST